MTSPKSPNPDGFFSQRSEGFINTPTRRIGEVHQNLYDEK